MTQPNKKKNAVIGIILSIGGCIGLLGLSAVTLLSSNVVSSQGGGVTMTYSGFEDKTEAVNELQFVQSGDQTDAGIVSQMYAGDDTTLVVTSNPLVSIPAEGQDNQLVGDADSQIIGGAGVQVGSDNITIIGGSNNQISGGNDSATVLGGTGNKLGNAGGSTPSVLVGGAGNEISDSEGGVIIGGSGNKIIGGSNSQILGGERNEVNVDNALVAGSGVQNTGAGNSFVFSDGSTRFSPATSGAFYISTEMGLGLNVESSSGSLASAGGISVGYIDIVNNSCNTSNVGVQGLYAGCLVGCTTGSALSGKWDLLEISNECITWCDSSSLCRDTIKKADYESYPGWCNVDSLGDLAGTAEPCDLDIDPDKYKDVVFDVDFVNECPNGDLTVLANPCVYKCPAGLVAEGGDCKAGCDFGSETLLHGEVRKGYAATGIVCGPDGKTCADYEVIVKCTNGHISYAQKPGAPIIVTTPSGIKGDTCSLSGVLCPSQYNLTSTGIVGGIFSGCTEYTSVGNTQCNTTTKYQLIGCESGYVKKEGEDVCLIGCKLPWSSTGLTVPYGTVVTGFENASIPCDSFGEATSCDRLSDTLQCGENGAWIGYPRIYSNPSCEVTAINPFTDYYNLSECPKARAASGTVVAGVIPEGTSIGYCEINTGYTVSGGQVCQIYYAYHLTGCIEGYSKSGDSCLPRCILPWSNDGLHYNTGGTDQTNAAKWTSGSIVYRQQIKGYKTISQQCPIPLATGSSNHLKGCEATDNWMTMTCGTGGVLPGKDTYKYKGCDSKPVPYPEEYNRNDPVANANCESFQPYSTGDNICNEDHLRWKCTSCKDGYTLNVDVSALVGGDLNARCLKDCTFDVTPTTSHPSSTHTLPGYNGSVQVYDSNLYTCPTEYIDHTETWYCNDGRVTGSRNFSIVHSGSRPYLDYVQTALRPNPYLVNDGTQTGVRTIEINRNAAHGISNTVAVDVSGRINISPYTTYFPHYLTGANPVCDNDKTYYYLKCKPDTNTTDRDGNNSYVWPTSTSNNTCIRCNGTVPENAHRNNATFPTSSSVDFHYSTNSSEICGFSCDDGYYWSGGACLSYYCDLNNGSIKVIHNTIRGSSKPIYKPSTNPICDTECEAIPAKCLYGEWRKLNGSTVTNEVITDAFDTCATRNGYVITYPTRQSPVAGTYNPSLGTYEKLLSTIPTNTQLKQQATNYIANGESCSEGDTKYKVECPQANYYWSGELCLKRCVSLTGAKYTQGQTISTYASSDPTCPTECSTVTAKCKSDGTWDRTLYGTCSTKTGSACTSDFNLTTQSDSNGLYAECSAANGTTCSSRYRLTGCVAGYTLYNGGCYKNCTLDGKTINYNTTGIWYSTNKTCADVATCASKKMVLKCTGTNKTSTYLVKDGTSTTVSTGFSGCVETCNGCTGTPWGNLSHKQIVTGAKASSLSCNSSSVKCEYGNIQCWNGSLSGDTSTYSKTGCKLNTVDNCPDGTSTTKRVTDTTFSDPNASLTNTCYAYYADNTNNTCTTTTYRYYECDAGYSWNSSMSACVADLGCGSAASQGCYSVSPSTSILCSNSTYSEFTTNDTTYSWKCSKDGTSVDCSVNRCAVCGSADGTTVSSAPSSNLCSVGTKSAGVTTNTNTYSWSCKNGMNTANCSAYRTAACGNADGTTVSSAPSSDLCSRGTKSAGVTTNTDTYTWSCKNGTSTVSCSAYRTAACGSANGVCRSSAPSTSSALCSRGTKSAGVTTNTNTYTWSCENGTSTVSCSSDRTAVCGNADGEVRDTKPTSSSDLCSRGTASTVSSSNGMYTWSCTNGSCSVGCSTSAPGACTTTDGYTVAHGVTDTYYTKTPVTCTSSTEKCSNYTKSLKCEDGDFYDGSTKWTNAVYKYCSTSDGSCSISDYNLTSSNGLSNCNLSSPVYCYVKNGDTACKQSSDTPRWKILSAKDGYYINNDKTDCLPKCPSGTISSPYCNDGSTPTNKDGVTYKNAYSYKCGIACSVRCGNGKVWNGNACIEINDPCVDKSTNATSSDAYKCTQGFSGNISNLNKGYFWDCKDGDNNVVDSCHACKAGYTWSGSANDCVMDNLCKTSTNPGSCYYGSASDYTTTEWYKGTYFRKCTYDGVTQSCSTKCADNQVYHGGSVKKCETIDACSTTKFECKQGMPLDFATGSTAYTWKCWDTSHSNVLGNCSVAASFSCQGSYPEHATIYTGTVISNKNWAHSSTLSGYCVFKCDTGYKYNYPGYHICEEDCDNSCNGGTYLTCPSSKPYTGGAAYTNGCKNTCYTCSTTPPSPCGPKPNILQYNGVSYQYNILYNGSYWYINDECTCNTSTRKWECTGYRGTVGHDTGIGVDVVNNAPPTSNCGSLVEGFIVNDSVSNQDATKACVHLCGGGPCNKSCTSYVGCSVRYRSNLYLCNNVFYLSCSVNNYVSPQAYSG